MVGIELGGGLSHLCREVSQILKDTGALLYPRCTVEDNDRFIDMMERYFLSPSEFKRLQKRPNLHYQVVSEMTAIGFGLPKDTFTSLMKQGPHLLAPTGSDLSRYGQEGIVFEGYHYDLNFLTIHGRSRFPGLNIWLRNGQKVEVEVPVGCPLIQTRKQIEWPTAGECQAGMHEVIVTNRTTEAIKLASSSKS